MIENGVNLMDAIAIVTSIILLREGLEAVLILTILWAIAKKIQSARTSRPIKLGAISALSLSLVLGLFLFLLAIEFEGLGEYLFEGFMSITAAIVVTYVVLWMSKHASNLRNILERKVSMASSVGSFWGIFSVAFFIVFREGIEAVLLIATLMNINALSTILGLVVGFIALIIVSLMIFFLGMKVPLKTFFRVTAIFLVIVAAGLLGYGIHEFIEALEVMGYEIGILSYKVWDLNWLIPEESAIGIFLKGLIGYEATPELLRVIVTTGYLSVAGYLLYRFMYRSESLPK